MSADAMRLFESLGDNCEFGFAQRTHGIRTGGLLRWTETFPPALIQNLGNGFDGLFAFDNLRPARQPLVADIHSGISFHTDIRSRGDAFLDREDERRAQHHTQAERIAFLRERMLALLARPSRHFIYKHNHGITLQEARSIAAAIRSYGPGQVLIVHRSNAPRLRCRTEHVEGNLWFGYMPSFATYAKADALDIEAWNRLTQRALAKMGPPAHEADTQA